MTAAFRNTRFAIRKLIANNRDIANTRSRIVNVRRDCGTCINEIPYQARLASGRHLGSGKSCILVYLISPSDPSQVRWTSSNMIVSSWIKAMTDGVGVLSKISERRDQAL